MSLNSTEPQKPVKTGHNIVRVSPLRLLGIFSVMFTCFTLMVMSSFISMNLPNLSDFNKLYSYVPQIPAVLMSATLLGSACSTLTVFACIILGLSFFPVFALGGGPDYVLNFGFGYLLAFIPAAFITGKFSEASPSLWKLIAGILTGVIMIHFFGFLYTILLGLALHEPSEFVKDWLFYESALKIPYDLVFSLALALFTGLLRKYLWVLTVK